MTSAQSDRWRLPRVTLPDGEERALWIVEGVITEQEVPDAAELPGRFVSPGLVDGHVHFFLSDDGQGRPTGMPEALAKMRAARAQGVLLMRDMGAPGALTFELPSDPDLPRVIACGRQLAVEGGFVAGSHVPVPPEELVDAALAEVARGATWVKVLADWQTPELTYPVHRLTELVEAVHASGARVAAHVGWEGVSEVVETGVDSIEHGWSLDEPTLRRMAEAGTAWAPTAAWVERDARGVEEFLRNPPEDATPERLERARNHFLPLTRRLAENVARMVPIAVALGVPVLASTDNAGTVAGDVELFVRYGLSPTEALRTATTVPRRFLDVRGLEEGAPADLVTYDQDPRLDPSLLASPAAVVLGGRRVS